ncbi:MAG: LPS export ABC transporter permease LptF, partial [Desulfobacterales bacterium]
VAGLMFIFLMAQILKITKWIVNYRIGLDQVFQALAYSSPYFLSFVIPMSVMMAVLLTFLRMSGDNEITALKAAGISFVRLLPPVLLFCLAGWILTGSTLIWGVPWGKSSLENMKDQLDLAHADGLIQERTFITDFFGFVLYFNALDLSQRTMEDVFIEDRSHKGFVNHIIAPRGRLIAHRESGTYRMQLYDGIINQVNLGEKSSLSISFKTYNVNLDPVELIKQRLGMDNQKDEQAMGMGELRQAIATATEKDKYYWRRLIEYHRRIALPWACIALGLLAVPLGIQSKSAKRSYGFFIALGMFFTYFVLMSAGMVFGESGVYPPLVGMWMPNILMGGAAFWFARRTLKERPLWSGSLAEMLERFRPRRPPKVSALPADPTDDREHDSS